MQTPETSARKAYWTWTEIVADLERVLEDTGGEVTPDAAALEELSAEEARFAIAEWARAFKDFKFKHEACNSAMQHYRDAAARNADMMRRCKGRIDELLSFLNERSVSTPTGSVYRTEGKQRVEVTPDDGVMERLEAMMLADKVYKPDLAEIGRQLKRGVSIPGCSLVKGDGSVVVK